jgi:AcrR family transcriptional regulator
VARKIPEHRFDDLVRVATEVFIAQGYRRTQMADVAEALGVAKGTLYGYVESKEALFELCLAHADDRDPIEVPARLPLPTPKPGALLRMLTTRLAARGELPRMAEALRSRRAHDIRVELEGVLRELYDAMESNHRAIKLIDVCALDHPELAAAWQSAGREGPRDRMADYLASRSRAGQLRPIADPSLAARLVIETITTWTLHIKWDRFPQRFAAKAARDNVIEFLVRGLLAAADEA